MRFTLDGPDRSSRSACRCRPCTRAYFEGVSFSEVGQHARHAGHHPARCRAASRPLAGGFARAGGRPGARCAPCSTSAPRAEAIAGGRLDTRLGRGRRPRPRRAGRAVQPHGPGPGGPRRARRPVRLRGQPRAALPADDPGRLGRGAREQPRRDPRAGRRPRSTCSSADVDRFQQLVEDLLEISPLRRRRHPARTSRRCWSPRW